MAPDFVSFLQAAFFLIELAIYKGICNALTSDCLSNDQKWDSKDNYHGTIQCYENNDKEMLSIYLPCLLSILLSMQGSTLLLNTTDNNVRKV